MASSTTPASHKPPPSPFSRLPPELIRQIIETLVPLRYRTATYDERQSTLRSLCRVSRLFYRISKPLLESVAQIKLNTQFELWEWHVEDREEDVPLRELLIDGKYDRWFSMNLLQPFLHLQLYLRTLVLEEIAGDLDIAGFEHLERMLHSFWLF